MTKTNEKKKKNKDAQFSFIHPINCEFKWVKPRSKIKCHYYTVLIQKILQDRTVIFHCRLNKMSSIGIKK